MATGNKRKPEGQAKPKAKRGPSAAVRRGKDDTAGGGGGSGSTHYFFVCHRHNWLGAGPCLECSNDQPAAGRAESVGSLELETGSSNRQPIGQGAEAEGGKREAGVSDGGAGEETGERSAESTVLRCYLDRGLQRAKSVGVIGTSEDTFQLGYALGWQEQERKTKDRTRYIAVTALLIGLALGLLLSAAYRLVLGS